MFWHAEYGVIFYATIRINDDPLKQCQRRIPTTSDPCRFAYRAYKFSDGYRYRVLVRGVCEFNYFFLLLSVSQHAQFIARLELSSLAAER